MSKKRYFRVKGFPDYLITVTGKIHRKTIENPVGFPVETFLDEKGCRMVEIFDYTGRLHIKRVEDLMDASLPKPKQFRPKSGLNQNEYRKIPYEPEYEINRLGMVRRISDGFYVPMHMLKGKPTPVYYLGGGRTVRYVNALLYDTFGFGAAEQAGYEECRRAVCDAKAQRR